MSVPHITTTITVPDPSGGRASFVAQSNAMGNNLGPYATEGNVLADFVNERADDAEEAATAATNAKAAAEAARDAAIAAATAVASDYNPAGFAYAKNALVWDGPNKLYRCILAYSSTATLPSADPTHWTRVNTTPEDVAAIVTAATNALLDVPIVRKTSAYTLALSDRGKCISTNSAVTIPANSAVAFPAGATLLIRNTSASAINLSITDDTLRKTGTTKTGTLSIPAYGTATIHYDGAIDAGPKTWFASGAN